jgi:hypothetical protein
MIDKSERIVEDSGRMMDKSERMVDNSGRMVDNSGRMFCRETGRDTTLMKGTTGRFHLSGKGDSTSEVSETYWPSAHDAAGYAAWFLRRSAHVKRSLEGKIDRVSQVASNQVECHLYPT